MNCIGGARGVGEGAARLQGRQYRSQMYFYYINDRGAHIYLAPGGNTPCSATGELINTRVNSE